jgi:Tol biopolymer transport system component
MAEVFEAQDNILRTLVALKVVGDEAGAPDEVTIERFRREIQLARKVTHPNVCRVFDVGVHRAGGDDVLFLTMELIDGETLAHRLRKGPLPLTDARPLVAQLAAGLQAAHDAGVVHRDFKSHNVILAPREDGGVRAVITDFGIARAAAAVEPKRTGDVAAASAAEGLTGSGFLGTPAYMAPEQVRGEDVGPAADVYAFGVVMFEVITGELPFRGADPAETAALRLSRPPPSPRTMVADLDPRWESAILRCLAREPAARFARPMDVAHALEPRRSRSRLVIFAAAASLAVATMVALLPRVGGRTGKSWQARIIELPAYDENSDAADVSPDGTRIAYMSDRERSGHYRIYVESLVDGSARPVTPPDRSFLQARFTSDGKRLIAQEYPGPGAYLLNDDGSDFRLLDRDAYAVSACGDGVLLVYEAPLRLVLTTRTGASRELRPPLAGLVEYVRCDRAGERIAIQIEPVKQPHPRSDIWLLTLDGDVRRLTADGLENRVGSFHPDGRSLLYSSRRDGVSQLWELPLGGGAPFPLSTGTGDHYIPVVFADGNRLLYLIDETTTPLFTYTASGGAPRRLTVKLEGFESIDVAPDGAELVVTVERNGERRVALVPTAGGAERELATGFAPVFSPDGDSVLFVDGSDPRRLLAVPRAGGAARVVTTAPAEIFSVAVAPDQLVQLAVRGAGAWSVPLAGGEPTRAASAPITFLRPAPTGGWQLAVIAQTRAKLLAPGMAPDDPNAIAFDGFRSIVWEHDGSSLLFVAGDELRRFRVASRTTETLFSVGDTVCVAPAPDGETVYVAGIVAHTRRAVISNYGELPRPWR